MQPPITAVINRLKEHRVQLVVGLAIATVFATIFSLYERDFEHRYDETFREWIATELADHVHLQKQLEADFKAGKISKVDHEKVMREERKAVAKLNKAYRAAYGHLIGHEWMEITELRLYDSRFRARGRLKPPDDIVIVAYDEEIMDQVKVWPWPRKFHAQVVDKLTAAGAKVIVFDTRFDAYQGAKPVKDFRSLEDLTPTEPTEGDLEFAEACRRSKRVIVTADLLLDSEEESSTRLHWRQILRAKMQETRWLSFPFPAGDEPWERGYGLSKKARDADTFIRRGFLLFEVLPPGEKTPEYIPSLAALAAGMYRGLSDDKLIRDLKRGVLDGKRIPVLRTLRNPTQHWHGSTALINYLGPRFTLKTIPYAQVLSDDPRVLITNSEQERDAKLRELFEGKLVFIGATAEILHDSFPGPFASKETPIPGVEIHATMAHTLLSGEFIHVASRAANVAAIFLVGYLTVLLGVLVSKPVASIATAVDLRCSFSLRGMKVRLYGPVWFVLYTMLGIGPPLGMYYLFALHLFINESVWITVVYPCATALLSYGGVVVTMFLTEEVNRRKAVSRFERMVAPSVLREILAHPGEAEDLPKPKRVQATHIFTDLQGFTTLSEQNSAETVVEVLNEYITRMVEVIHKHGGTIDKYEGDAIMIAFGIPVPQADHAQRAMRACIEMQEACTKFRIERCRTKGWPDFYMRIGINSGEVIAGLIGGGDRYDYTSIGDPVNLAARLEPLNKQCHSWILCSDRTYEYVKDFVIAESVPGIQVKGKTQAVDVYAIHGFKETGRRDHIWGEDADKAPKAPEESTIGPRPEPANGGQPELPEVPEEKVDLAELPGGT